MTEPVILSIAEPVYLKTIKEINALYYGKLEIKADAYVKTKSYLEFDDELWVVKKIRKKMIEGLVTFLLDIEHNMCELNDKTIAAFDMTDTPENVLTEFLSGTGWTVGTIDGPTGSKRVRSKKRISRLKALWLMASEWDGEFEFHSKTRIVDFKTLIGNQTKKQPIRYDKNSDYIVREEDATELVTRLYIYGADDITVKTANPTGLTYIDSPNIDLYIAPVEDTIYTTIADAANLYAYGLAYLDLYDDEIYRYDINIADMTVFKLWAAEGVYLGDAARVQNIDLNLNIDVRVKKITKDHMDPNQYVIELDNVHDNMARRLANWYDKLTEIAPYDDAPGTIDPGNVPGYDDGGPIIRNTSILEYGVATAGAALLNQSQKKVIKDSDGGLHVVYMAAGNTEAWYAKSVDGGKNWSKTKLIESSAAFVDFSHPAIALGSGNEIYVVVNGSGGSSFSKILFMASTNGGESWSAPQELTAFGSNYVSHPSIAIDTAGTIHVVAIIFYGTGYVYHISSGNGGSSWSASHKIWDSTIIAGTIFLTPGVALEISHNDCLHVAIGIVVGAKDMLYYVNSVNAGASWGNWRLMNHSVSNSVTDFCLAVGFANYSLYFAWVEAGTIYYETVTNNVWSESEQMSEIEGGCYEVAISLDRNDKIYVVWCYGEAFDSLLKKRVFNGENWLGVEIINQLATLKRTPHLCHAQNPEIGIRPCIINNGFVLVYAETSDNINFTIRTRTEYTEDEI